MKRVIKLTESQLKQIISKVVSEKPQSKKLQEGLDYSKMDSLKGITSKQLNDCIVSNGYPLMKQIDFIQNQKNRDMVMNSCRMAVEQKNDGKALECAFFISQMPGLINAGSVHTSWVNTVKCIQTKVKQSMSPSGGVDKLSSVTKSMEESNYNMGQGESLGEIHEDVLNVIEKLESLAEDMEQLTYKIDGNEQLTEYGTAKKFDNAYIALTKIKDVVENVEYIVSDIMDRNMDDNEMDDEDEIDNDEN